jgi:tripartite-type tricarboxylate transporter receptor subunit TctC
MAGACERKGDGLRQPALGGAALSYVRAAFIRVAAAVAMLLATSDARAQDPSAAAYYKGKTVKFIVGIAAGGGYDAYARMLAPFIARELDATVIVENHPAAAGLFALNNLYVTPPGEPVLSLVNGTGAAMSQLLAQPGARYDLERFAHLGIVSVSPWVWGARRDLAWKTPADFRAAPRDILWAATGIADALSDGASAICEALSLRCHIVLGYPGTNQSALAVANGEVDAVYASDTSANVYVKSGRLDPVTVFGRKRSRYFPDLPTVFEQVDLPPDKAWWVDLRSNLDNVGRILLAQPGLPTDRLAYLRSVLAKVLRDPAVIAEGERTQRVVDFVDAEAAQAMVHHVLSGLTGDQKALAVETLTRKYF